MSIQVEHVQSGHRVGLEWGRAGVAALAPTCSVLVVVDVLSFGTAVDIVVSRGARVLPQRWGDPAATAREASAAGAISAGPRRGVGPSLRPSSLLELASDALLALPSPNGATLCHEAAALVDVVFAGCLRNASAVAATARTAAGSGAIGLIPAGERWPDGTMRVAVEDALGAGAIAAALGPARDPDADPSAEALLAVAQFRAAQRARLLGVLTELSSGRELAADGFIADVELAAAHDTSAIAPRLHDGVLTGVASAR